MQQYIFDSQTYHYKQAAACLLIFLSAHQWLSSYTQLAHIRTERQWLIRKLTHA